jgi:hypothetical protein
LDQARIGSTLNLSASSRPERFLFMKKRKCSFCGKAAFAYRIEVDESKTYLCLKHLPDGEAPEPRQATPDPAPSAQALEMPKIKRPRDYDPDRA